MNKGKSNGAVVFRLLHSCRSLGLSSIEPHPQCRTLMRTRSPLHLKVFLPCGRFPVSYTDCTETLGWHRSKHASCGRRPACLLKQHPCKSTPLLGRRNEASADRMKSPSEKRSETSAARQNNALRGLHLPVLCTVQAVASALILCEGHGCVQP